MTGYLPALRRDGRRGPDRAGAYAKARRHSGRVRLLKIAIPAGALVAGGLVLAAPLFRPLGDMAGLSMGGVSMSGTKIAMENPRLTGFRKDNRPYEVTAKAAFQDVRKPGLVELRDVSAKLATDAAGTFANLVSASALFDTAKEIIDLSQDIRITTTRGEEVLLRSASVDIKGGTVVSREPVRITTQNGTIEAEGVEVSDGGRTISFQGRVRTQFSRAAIEPAEPTSGEVGRMSQAAEPAR
ncbi:LPS export ABC transporter periplasmic protein LptC [Enterovirga aerilata]|uniref:LPS export ABC transporter periplasmic protein LptC n=1 Tax=Enterovirga aerilata TaxID=2730920 RepID=A0A849I9I8_9HYPH|nr:LPS export ABC transporter periplasmic protein LptC [Enterovirga sp. DB1703]